MDEKKIGGLCIVGGLVGAGWYMTTQSQFAVMLALAGFVGYFLMRDGKPDFSKETNIEKNIAEFWGMEEGKEEGEKNVKQ